MVSTAATSPTGGKFGATHHREMLDSSEGYNDCSCKVRPRRTFLLTNTRGLPQTVRRGRTPLLVGTEG